MLIDWIAVIDWARYEDAISKAGLDMRSDGIYNDYLQWLMSEQDWFGAANLCDRTLATPLYPHKDCVPQKEFLTQYEALVDEHDPGVIATPDELTQVTAARHSLRHPLLGLA